MFVIVRLHKLGLLPEEHRLRHIKSIRSLAAETPDAGILKPGIRSLFTAEEFEEAMDHIRSGLIENLPAVLDVWRDNKESDRDPEDYMSEYKGALKEFMAEFEKRADEAAVGLIAQGLGATEEAIRGMWEDMPPEPDYDREDFRSSSSSGDYGGGERSVFDDVDSK